MLFHPPAGLFVPKARFPSLEEEGNRRPVVNGVSGRDFSPETSNDQRRCAMRSRIVSLLALAGVLLTVLSAIVIFQGATDEPYFRFDAKDALVQVGAGSSLLTLWAVYVAYCLYLIATQRRLRCLVFVLSGPH